MIALLFWWFTIIYIWCQSLLSMESAKQRESKKLTDEILQLLSKPTAKVCICLPHTHTHTLTIILWHEDAFPEY